MAESRKELTGDVCLQQVSSEAGQKGSGKSGGYDKRKKLFQFSINVIITMTSSILRRSLFYLEDYIVHHQKKSEKEFKHGRNLERGADAGAMEELCLLACFS